MIVLGKPAGQLSSGGRVLVVAFKDLGNRILKVVIEESGSRDRTEERSELGSGLESEGRKDGRNLHAKLGTQRVDSTRRGYWHSGSISNRGSSSVGGATIKTRRGWNKYRAWWDERWREGRRKLRVRRAQGPGSAGASKAAPVRHDDRNGS